MTICPFCSASIDDKSTHYAGDACPALVTAFGAVTAAGQRRERETHYRLDEAEKDARREERRTKQRSNRMGFVAKAVTCRVCGAPAWRNGRCEPCEKAHISTTMRAYYLANRERMVREKRERRAEMRVSA